MPVQNILVDALKDLEADLRHVGVSSSAIVYLDKEKARDEVYRVFEAVSKLGVINYSQNFMDMRFVEGTDYRIESFGLTKETAINTLAGKLMLPGDIKLRLSSKR